MSKVVGQALQLIGVVAGMPWLQIAGTVIVMRAERSDAKKARRRARDEYNASLQDRLEMVDSSPDMARTLALGRVRAVEGVRRRWTSGANSERLTMVVSFAGHEIDGFEQFYLDDVAVTLDGAGWVQEAPYRQSKRTTAFATAVLDGGGGAVIALPSVPLAGSVRAVWRLTAHDSVTEGTATVNVVGTTATVSGGSAGADVTVSYESDNATSHVRIRTYLGTATQNVGADLAAEYPGKITATDKFAGIALAVVDLVFNADVFPQGRPNVTALFRGAKLYDPRLDSTQPGGSGAHRLANPATWAWTENPALHVYSYALWAHGWAVPAAEIRTADVMAAANACDVATDFTLRKPDTSINVVNLPRYRSGAFIASDADPRASMDELFEAMAGRHGWAGGQWRFRAGALGATAFSVQPSWIARPAGEDGEANDEPVVRLTTGIPREGRVNRLAGRCVDPDQRWQVLPFPGVEDPVRIAAQGLLQGEIEYQAVNHVAHAQHLCSVAIRQSHAGLRGEIACNLHAWQAELLDVGTLDLPRYGMSGKTVEVTGWRWSPKDGIALTVEEITADIFTPLAELTGRDPAPDSNLPRPWAVPIVAGVVAVETTITEPGGRIVAVADVSWAPIAQASVTQVEVAYMDAVDGGEFSIQRADSLTGHRIIGLAVGRHHLIKVRAVNSLGVRGDWSLTAVLLLATSGGGSAQLLRMTSNGFAFIFAGAAATTSTSPTLVFAVSLQNVTGTVTFTATAYDAANAVLGAVTLTNPTATTRELTSANFNAPGPTTVRYVKVTASLGALSDSITVYRGDDGSSALNMVLGNEAHTVPTDSAGAGGVFTGASTAVRMYEGINDVTSLWAFARADSGCTSLINGVAGPVTGTGTVNVAVSAMSADSATVTITATRSGYPTHAKVFSLSKSKAGAAGDKSAVVYIYQRAVSTPPLPSNTTTYFFATGLAAGMNNGWAATIPAGASPLYVTAATATAAGGATTDTIANTEWSAPVILAQDGLEGAKAASVFIYRRTPTNSAPALPSATATYTFSTGVTSGLNNSWTTSVPAAGGNPYLWVSTATALGTGSTDTIGSGEWAAAQLMAQDGVGTPGSTGQSNHRVYRAVTIGSPPATPGNTTSGATPAGWSATPLALSAGQEQYQSDGTTPAGSTATTWATPYPSYLKVGSLSAISANLGTVTAGSITGTSSIDITGSAKLSGINSGISIPDPFNSPSNVSRSVAALINNTDAAQVGIYSRSAAAGAWSIIGINTNTGAGSTGVMGYGREGVVGVGYPVANSYGVVASGASNTGCVGLYATAGLRTAVLAQNFFGGSALEVIGTSTFDNRITSTIAGNVTPLVLPRVTAKPAAIAGGICLHNTLGLIVSDGANWYGPSGGLVVV